MADVKRMLLEGLRSTKRAISLGDMGLDREEDELSLSHLTEAIARSLSQKRSASLTDSLEDGVHKGELPKVITFPYSRHSSYDELCHLVKVFAPKDIYPCTVDEENWHEGLLDHSAVSDKLLIITLKESVFRACLDTTVPLISFAMIGRCESYLWTGTSRHRQRTALRPHLLAQSRDPIPREASVSQQ